MTQKWKHRHTDQWNRIADVTCKQSHGDGQLILDKGAEITQRERLVYPADGAGTSELPIKKMMAHFPFFKPSRMFHELPVL